MKCRRFIVTGLVQGVCYRRSVERAINSANIEATGFVRNLKDGTVEIVVKLPENNLPHLLELIKAGPYASRVDHVEVSECDEEVLKEIVGVIVLQS